MIRHWPVILFGIIVATVFLLKIFTFQASTTQWVVVSTFGKITSVQGGDSKAGLKFRWPVIQKITRYDRRSRCFIGNTGEQEETFTKDGKNLILGIYVIYNIEDPKKFYKVAKTIPFAEDSLNSMMRTMKVGVIGRFNSDQIINTNPSKMRLQEIEHQIMNGFPEITDKNGKVISPVQVGLAPMAMKEYGIKITSVGIRSIGIPESITQKVFERMIKEREVVAKRYRAEGKKEADKIKYHAESKSARIRAEAKAKSKRIRAEGDAKAASHYVAFKQNPALAAFLKKLDALRNIIGDKTTLVLDTNSAPFDILKMDANQLELKDSKEKR